AAATVGADAATNVSRPRPSLCIAPRRAEAQPFGGINGEHRFVNCCISLGPVSERPAAGRSDAQSQHHPNSVKNFEVRLANWPWSAGPLPRCDRRVRNDVFFYCRYETAAVARSLAMPMCATIRQKIGTGTVVSGRPQM